MEKEIKILMGALAILSIVFVLTQGEITGKATACSEKPEIISIEAIGDTISLDWKDTSTFKGQAKYETLIFKQQEDGSYNFNEATDMNIVVKRNSASFGNLNEANYIVKVRAKNPFSCSEGYSEYATSAEIFVDTSYSGRGRP